MYLASSSIDEKTFMAEPVTDFKDIEKVMPIIELAYYLNNKENLLFNKFLFKIKIWLSVKLKIDFNNIFYGKLITETIYVMYSYLYFLIISLYI